VPSMATAGCPDCFTPAVPSMATAIHGTSRSARRAAHAEARLKTNAKMAEPAA
jgi:hypothetical protein